MADSSTGGYLAPVDAPPPQDDDLDAVLQRLVVGITGLGGSLVRPRWQPLPPPEPPIGANWCAIGAMDQTPDPDAFVGHDQDGTRSYRRNAELDVLASFYGPNARGYAQRLSDGLLVGQNIEAIQAEGFVFVGSGALRNLPDLVHLQWRRRFDLPLTLRRRVGRAYPILSVASAGVTLPQEP